MARIIQGIFGPRDGNVAGIVRESDAARARVEEASRLRSVLLDERHMNEMYSALAGLGDMTGNVKPSDLMTPPDEVRWGANFPQIVKEMGANVLGYGALREGVKDVITSLPMIFLPGMKGDAESERAAVEVQERFEAIDERSIALRSLCDSYESGFAPVELVWDVDADDYVAPAALINRPRTWFGFDYLNRPRFKPEHRSWAPEFDLVPEFKVMFARCGSLHTPHGRGYAEECYPSVFAIDTAMKIFIQNAERAAYLPAVVTYPKKYGRGSRYQAMVRAVMATWKNAVFVPGDVETEVVNVLTEGASAASVNGAQFMSYVQQHLTFLSMRIRGSQPTSGTSQTGSLAREQVTDSAQLWKAPSYAAVLEAAINRGYIAPCMLVNRPTLPKKKWPRVSIDAGFGEDIALRLKIYESAVNMGFMVEAVTFSEEMKLPMAQPGSGQPLLKSAAPPALAPADPNAEPPVNDAANPVSSFAEQLIEIVLKDGRHVKMFADSLLYTENRGVLRAGDVQAGDFAILTPEHLRAVS